MEFEELLSAQHFAACGERFSTRQKLTAISHASMFANHEKFKGCALEEALFLCLTDINIRMVLGVKNEREANALASSINIVNSAFFGNGVQFEKPEDVVGLVSYCGPERFVADYNKMRQKFDGQKSSGVGYLSDDMGKLVDDMFVYRDKFKRYENLFSTCDTFTKNFNNYFNIESEVEG